LQEKIAAAATVGGSEFVLESMPPQLRRSGMDWARLAISQNGDRLLLLEKRLAFHFGVIIWRVFHPGVSAGGGDV
jgi:hypothetical protein